MNYVYQIHVGPYKQIGSSNQLKTRMKNHENALKENRHWNVYLQSVYNIHKIFSYEILSEHETREEAFLEEQRLLDLYFNKPYYTMLNGRAVGGSLPGKLNHNYGRKWSRESVEKRAASNRGKPMNEERKKYMSDLMKQKYFSGELIHPFVGRSHSEEARRKMSEYQRNRPPASEETRKKLSEANKGELNYFYGKHFVGELNPFFGKSHSDDAKRKISEANSFVKDHIKCDKCLRSFDPGNYKKHIKQSCPILPDQIKEILEMFKSGKSVRQIYLKMNLTQKLVDNILMENGLKNQRPKKKKKYS